MTTGNVSDFASRIISVLPPWFPDPVDAPVTYALIQGVATVMAQCYSLLSYVRLQTRLQTSTDGWLDLFSLDFFGLSLPRRTGEMDAAYRARIAASLFLEKGTRNGLVKALTLLTGTAPTVFEPARPQDAFCLGYSGLGVGMLGSYTLNNQALVTVAIPPGSGGANIAGLSATYAGLGSPYMAVVSQDTLYGSIRNQDVYNTVENTRPAGSTVWVKITS